MREDLEKLVFDTLHEVAKPEFDGFELRKRIDLILTEHDNTVEQETESAFEEGRDEGQESSYWEIDDARAEGYDDGYQDGWDAAKSEDDQAGT